MGYGGVLIKNGSLTFEKVEKTEVLWTHGEDSPWALYFHFYDGKGDGR